MKESGGKLQITWDNPKELEVYITKLQSAAEKLSTENRKLRKWHTDFIEKVVARWSLLAQVILFYVLFRGIEIIICHFAGGDTDERGPAETSAAVEGRPSGTPHWLCHFGVSGFNSSVCHAIFTHQNYNSAFITQQFREPGISVAASKHE